MSRLEVHRSFRQTRLTQEPHLVRLLFWSQSVQLLDISQLICLLWVSKSTGPSPSMTAALLPVWLQEKKKRCFASFTGYYCGLIHLQACSRRLHLWWLTTHPQASRHQCDQCICCAEPWAQLGARGLSVHPSGLRRFERLFHWDFQHSFVFSAASKQQITTNVFFERGVCLYLYYNNSWWRKAALHFPRIHVLTDPEIPKPASQPAGLNQFQLYDTG